MLREDGVNLPAMGKQVTLAPSVSRVGESLVDAGHDPGGLAIPRGSGREIAMDSPEGLEFRAV